MKYRASIYTLALLGALALAAVSGGLLTTSDNVVYAAQSYVGQQHQLTRSVDENTPPGVNIGDPISATDPDETGVDRISAHRVRQHADLQTRRNGRGVVRHRRFDRTAHHQGTAGLGDGKTEDLLGDGDSGRRRNSTATGRHPERDDHGRRCRRSNTGRAPVPADRGVGEDPNTTDTNESTTSLKVVWHPPENMGRPEITGFTVEYKKSTETDSLATVDATNVDQTGTTTNSHDHGAGGRHFLRRAGAGDEQRGHRPYELVARGDRLDQQGGQQPALIQRGRFTARTGCG